PRADVVARPGRRAAVARRRVGARIRRLPGGRGAAVGRDLLFEAQPMRLAGLLVAALLGAAGLPARDAPVYRSELVFPLEHWHNHASIIVQAPNATLLAHSFH